MKKITLMRHAKSSWSDADLSDHDRPLNERGLNDAPMMSKRLLQHGGRPDRILCSSSVRTRQTLQYVVENTLPGESLDNEKLITVSEDLYLASAGTLLEQIQNTDASKEHVLVIAHNPGIESLGRMLHSDAPDRMPTAAICQFGIHGNSFVLGEDTRIELLYHDFPKKI